MLIAIFLGKHLLVSSNRHPLKYIRNEGKKATLQSSEYSLDMFQAG
jgi:hypothetical protein